MTGEDAISSSLVSILRLIKEKRVVGRQHSPHLYDPRMEGAMVYTSESIASRIAWCQWQKTQTSAQLDLQAWHAEEEGLRDALLNIDHTNQYRDYPRGVFERYLLGLQDGRAMIRMEGLVHHHATRL